MTKRALLFLASAAGALAQSSSRQLTAADYSRAEKFMSYNTEPLMLRSNVHANWIGGSDRFWYRVAVAVPESPGGEASASFFVVDAATGVKQSAFDHLKVANALALAVGGDAKYDATHLPFQEIELNADSITVSAKSKRWKCDVAGSACLEDSTPAQATGRGRRGFAPRNDSPSPDGTKTVLINLETAVAGLA